MSIANNGGLNRAAKAKNDEFYTLMEDVQSELQHYLPQLRGKVVYCNCDDPAKSNFWRYFFENYNEIGLGGLVATHYSGGSTLYKTTFDGEAISREELGGDGDFRSPEVVEVLRGVDVVVTNPPFSLFRAFLNQLVEHKKDFLLISHMVAPSGRDAFPLIKSGAVKLGGYSGKMAFEVPEGGQKGVNVCWLTTLVAPKRRELELNKRYSPEEYLTYENYDAINVDRVADIPGDYQGIMGVPVTYLSVHDPSRFELIGISESSGRGLSGGIRTDLTGTGAPRLLGKNKFTRVFIRRIKDEGL